MSPSSWPNWNFIVRALKLRPVRCCSAVSYPLELVIQLVRICSDPWSNFEFYSLLHHASWIIFDSNCFHRGAEQRGKWRNRVTLLLPMRSIIPRTEVAHTYHFSCMPHRISEHINLRCVTADESFPSHRSASSIAQSCISSLGGTCLYILYNQSSPLDVYFSD